MVFNKQDQLALSLNENLFEKFKSFNWDATEIDGHNFDEIEKVFKVNSKRPKAIIAKTIRGKVFRS